MAALIIERCGPGTTVQDAGRFGWQRFGIGPAGAMDRVGMAEANLLVGNAPALAVIELALAGARFRVEGGRARVAVGGAAADFRIDGRAVPPAASATVDDGQVIEIGAPHRGMYIYLALAGGLDLAPQLGAVATHVRARLGGIDGRALRPGDRLACRLQDPNGDDLAALAPLAPQSENGPVRVILGPQDDYFEPAAIATLCSEHYTVTPQVDRMGIRLAGPKLTHGVKGYNIVSDGIVTGSIQVPGMGEPLILLADRQTTGGYPKIATVITADLSRLAQMRPGTQLRFAAVSRAEALAALAVQHARLSAFSAGLRPASDATNLSSERLLSLNLIDTGSWAPH